MKQMISTVTTCSCASRSAPLALIENARAINGAASIATNVKIVSAVSATVKIA